MILTLLVFPIAAGLIMLFFKSRVLNSIITITYAVALAAISGWLLLHPQGFTPYFHGDSLNSLFLMVLAIVFFFSMLYNAAFLKDSGVNKGAQTLYSVFLLLFAGSMAGAILAAHLALFWAFAGLATLTASYLIFFYRTNTALNAAWKYLFICSIGIALALVGIIFLTIGTGDFNWLFFDSLYLNAKKINPLWLKLGFVFILIGFGTKAGLAPLHSWLPDVHLEAPPAVSALISGALLNVAFLGIIRMHKLMDLAALGSYSRLILLIMGFLSLFLCAIFVLKVKEYHKMLAYSSIEHMGFIAICFAIGGPAVFAGLLHMVFHALSKAAFLLTGGTIRELYHSNEISEVTGLRLKDNLTAWLWVLSFIAVSGIPPSPVFYSKFLFIQTMIEKGLIVQLVMALLLLITILFGMGRSVLIMFTGESPAPIQTDYQPRRKRILLYLPQILLFFLLFSFILGVPDALRDFIQKASDGITR